MARTHNTLTELFTDIADSIREKTGSEEQIVADNFPTEISNIPSGGDVDPTFTGHYDNEGLTTIGWSNEEIQYYQDNGVMWDAGNDNFYKLTEDELKGDESNKTRYLPKSSTITNLYGYKRLLAIPNNTGYSNFYGCYSLITIPLIDTSQYTSFNNMFSQCHALAKIPLLNTSNCNNFSHMFAGCHALKEIPQLDTSKGTKFNNMFANCNSLTKIPQLDTSKGTNFNNMFANCNSLTKIPQLDTSKGTDCSYMFSDCTSLKEIPQLNTSSCTNFNYMFSECDCIYRMPQIDTSKGTNLSQMFNNCWALMELPELDCSSCTNISGILGNSYSLESLGGFKDLGKAYETSRAANYSSYTLNLNFNNYLTHDSLMNVINNLYDIASAGVQPQKLQLGSYHLPKLTSEEIVIATNKGWTVS